MTTREASPLDPRPDEDTEADPILAGLGYRGDPIVMRARLARERELEREGKGPRAYHRRLMAALGYITPWRAKAGDYEVPRVDD